jgi:glucose/arabinose dehydrogenase
VGASCADCEDTDSRRAAVLVFDLDGSNERIFAGGLYQVMGLAVNPITGQVWASNQGRPKMDTAPETLYALQNGATAGFPACIAGQIAPEAKFQGADCTVENLDAPLLATNPQGNIANLLFWQGEAVPAAYAGSLLYALHGGVIGSGRSGEQVEFGLYYLGLDAAGNLAGEPAMLIEGFWVSEEPGDYLGRPFGLAAWPDGTLFVSDDASGAVYQIKSRP